jgi:hypothetical protein
LQQAIGSSSGQSAGGSNSDYSCHFQLLRLGPCKALRLSFRTTLHTSKCVGSLYFARSNLDCSKRSVLRPAKVLVAANLTIPAIFNFFASAPARR